MLKGNKLAGQLAWINPTILAFMGGAASVRVFDLFQMGRLFSFDALSLAILAAFGLGLSIAFQVAARPAK